MIFYVGLHQPSDAQHFATSCISVNRLRRRRGPFKVGRWIMDSGAFTEISTHGRWRSGVGEYAEEVRRWVGCGELEAAVAQDYMCEPVIIEKTGLSVAEHQRLTIERYDALLDEKLPVPVLPVLQGFAPDDYARHVAAYGDRLAAGMWVGVGSVCKRNGRPGDVLAVLRAIMSARPDLRLHGFGLKVMALRVAEIRAMLHSSDSMAWSYAARREGRNQNDWREAERFAATIAASTAGPTGGWQAELAL